jgi:hypothetical protein
MGGLFALLFFQAWLMTSAEAVSSRGLFVDGSSSPYSWIIKPLAALGAVRAAILLNVGILALASISAARVLQKRWGSSAPVAVTIFAFGSVVFARALVAEPQIFFLSSVVLAFVLMSHAERPQAHDTPEMYYEPNIFRRVAPRWFVAGVLLAIPVAHDPIYLCLFLPALLSTPRSRQKLASISLAAGAIILLALMLAAGGFDGAERGSALDRQSRSAGSAEQPEDGDTTQELAKKSFGRWRQPLEGLLKLPDWGLMAWNGLYFLVGRNLGIVPYCLPILLILSGWGTSRREAALVGSVALASALALWLYPSSFSGGTGGLGNGRFLPLYGALWLLPTRRPRAGGIVTVAVMAGLFVWPLWVSPEGATHRLMGTARYASKMPFRFLPYEASQRNLPHFGALHRQGLLVHSLNPAIEYSSEGDRLVLAGGEWGELAIASQTELYSVFLDFDKNASTELFVGGGELANTLLRPNGRVAFQVGVEESHLTYPNARTGQAQFHYRLRVKMEISEKASFSLNGVIVDGESGVAAK